MMMAACSLPGHVKCECGKFDVENEAVASSSNNDNAGISLVANSKSWSSVELSRLNSASSSNSLHSLNNNNNNSNNLGVNHNSKKKDIVNDIEDIVDKTEDEYKHIVSELAESIPKVQVRSSSLLGAAATSSSASSASSVVASNGIATVVSPKIQILKQHQPAETNNFGVEPLDISLSNNNNNSTAIVNSVNNNNNNSVKKLRCEICFQTTCPTVRPPKGYYSIDQISRHSRPDDCWIIAHGYVFDVTRYVTKHPGGSISILSRAGQDASKDFDFHSSFAKNKLWKRFQIGKVAICPKVLRTTNDEECCIS